MTLRIVIVDDNADDRLLGRRVIQQVLPEAVIDEAWDRETLEAAWATPLDVLVTDYALRWTTGLEVLAASRLRFPEVPVIMFTNTGSEEVCAEGMKRGLYDYVIKRPGHFGRLAAAVRAAIEASELRRRVALAEQEREALLASERAARLEAERANRLKDDFLAALSHELRTPLNAILGWTHILQSGKVDPANVSRGMQVIDRNARVQTRLIDDLLDLSRAISGRLRLEVEDTALAPVAEAAIAAVATDAERKGLSIVPAIAQGLNVKADPQRLQQVLGNLLSNAVKFSSAKGRIDVAARAEGREVVIQVSDQGQGIAPDFLPLIFERFRQADASINRQQGGLGIGLSIVRYLVEAQQGSVAVESPGLGKGSTFTVRLPSAATDGIRGPIASAPRARALQGVLVVHLDDDADSRELIERFLGAEGATVVPTEKPDEALGRIALERPHVFVCDIGMPGEDGYSVVRRLRSHEDRIAAATPAIALTAFAREDDRLRALDAGFDAFVSKPIDVRRLVQAVAAAAGPRGQDKQGPA